MIKLFYLLLLSFLFSCNHLQSRRNALQAKKLPSPKKLTQKNIPKLSKVQIVQKVSRKSSGIFKEDLSLNYSDKLYKFWINYFSTKDKARFKRHLKNADRYEDVVRNILHKHKLPQDLFYVALIESGYNTHIRSRASAVGPWQFIRGTGKRYGLRIDSKVDERRSIYKSTEAAAQYFKDLYNIFGSWELALCAYNAGEYRIINAIRRGNTRSYKKLVKMKLIPKETIYYIPKVAAARHLARKWKRVRNVSEQKFYRNVKPIYIKGNVNLLKLARQSKMLASDFKKLNPDFNYRRNSFLRRGVKFYVPAPKHQSLLTHIKGKWRTATSTKKSNRRPSQANKRRTKAIGYRVKRNDNLHKIANKFGVEVKTLIWRNRLRSSKLFVGQWLKIPANYKNKTKKHIKHKIYVVKKGDNLIRIARRFGISVKRLIAFNDLKGKVIHPRQTIRIPSG